MCRRPRRRSTSICRPSRSERSSARKRNLPYPTILFHSSERLPHPICPYDEGICGHSQIYMELKLCLYLLFASFLKSGVYLVLEKLKLQVYQRLVKKMQKEPAKAHQIKLDVVVKALKWLEIDMDVDEVECIMSCLIYKNLIKGYFPKLNEKPVYSQN
nr:unnamed protein product [Digitaria exilis]